MSSIQAEKEQQAKQHEEQIEGLNAQVASIQAEKEEQAKQHDEQLVSLQAEIEQLKKILATN